MKCPSCGRELRQGTINNENGYWCSACYLELAPFKKGRYEWRLAGYQVAIVHLSIPFELNHPGIDFEKSWITCPEECSQCVEHNPGQYKECK